MYKDIVIIGYSGHSYGVIESALSIGLDIIGYCDLLKKEKNPFSLKYLGKEDVIFEDAVKWPFFVSIGNNYVRNKISEKLRSMNNNLVSIVDPSSLLNNSVVVGNGTFISKNVCVNSCVEVGDDVILNTGCIIEHECKIDNCVHVGPGSVLCGNVTVGKRSFIGANSTIKQGIKIGDDVIIGAGSLILKDVPNNSTVYGNPVKDEKK